MLGRYEEEYECQGGVWMWRKIVALFDVQNEFATNGSRVKQRFKKSLGDQACGPLCPASSSAKSRLATASSGSLLYKLLLR